VFGFLLHRGGVTNYDVILGQLLLDDFTVLKIMLAAVVTGALGLHVLQDAGRIRLAPKHGSWGRNAIGGLIFGAGFGLLGYCPGTIAAAVGNGFADAATGGFAGILVGSAALAAIYPRLERGILRRGAFRELTVPRLLGLSDWQVILPLVVAIVLLLALLERAGL